MKRPHFALPEIYDDSLSYYDVLRKLIKSIHVISDNLNKIPEQIANEAKSRLLGDQNLQQNINSEATTREQADITLQHNINEEASAREQADQEIREGMSNKISELKGDLINVNNTKADKSDLAKTNLYLDALYKLNKGQTYDVLEQESEAYSVDVPSGSKYAGIDKVGGKSVVWNQLFPNALPKKIDGDGVTIVTTDSEYICTVKQPRIGGGIWFMDTEVKTPNNHKIYGVCQTYSEKATTLLYKSSTSSAINNVSANKWTKCSGIFDSNAEVIEIDVDTRTFEVGDVFKHRNFSFIDLTKMFGAGNEPSTVEEFEAMFPADYYPYSEPTIISSQTDRVDVASADGTITQQITTGFPVLNSAGSVYDYIDLNDGKLYTWTYIDGNEIKALTEPVITDIEIPTELTDWLTVEAGGSVTFHNSDEGKRLIIPNKLSFVRKLDEVSV